MKKTKMTKAERLAAYKAEKAAAKLLKEQHSLLADIISAKTEVILTNNLKSYRHDCLLMAKDYRDEDNMEQQIKLLYGDSRVFRSMAGRLTFPVKGFFEYAKSTNPNLLAVLPPVLLALFKERMIDFIPSEEKDIGGMIQAVFNIVRL